jgi:hypothetical protein
MVGGNNLQHHCNTKSLNMNDKQENRHKVTRMLGAVAGAFTFTKKRFSFLITTLAIATLHKTLQDGRPNSNPTSIHLKPPSKSESSEQYLYYFSYAGWSNQLTGLYHAAQLASSTNRTLIVPPILSHHSANDMGNARGGNTRLRCGPDHLDMVKLDAKECLKSPDESSHVKFSEIINMAKLSEAINVPFTDLCEFVKEKPALAKRYFHQMEQMKPEQRTIDLSGTCTLDHRRSYADMVEHFESIFAKDAVAIIPSAFILSNANSETKNFEQNVFRYPPSSNLSEFIRILRDRLPKNYIGVHLRYRDDAEYSEYDEYRFKCSENKTEVLDMIRRGHLAMIEKNEATANITPSVFFASNSQEALSCYKQFLSDVGVQAFSLNDLLGPEKNSTRKFLSAIKASKSTIYLTLDQILVSLGQQVVLLSKRLGHERNIPSSFQTVIKTRHEHLNNSSSLY